MALPNPYVAVQGLDAAIARLYAVPGVPPGQWPDYFPPSSMLATSPYNLPPPVSPYQSAMTAMAALTAYGPPPPAFLPPPPFQPQVFNPPIQCLMRGDPLPGPLHLPAGLSIASPLAPPLLPPSHLLDLQHQQLLRMQHEERLVLQRALDAANGPPGRWEAPIEPRREVSLAEPSSAHSLLIEAKALIEGNAKKQESTKVSNAKIPRESRGFNQKAPLDAAGVAAGAAILNMVSGEKDSTSGVKLLERLRLNTTSDRRPLDKDVGSTVGMALLQKVKSGDSSSSTKGITSKGKGWFGEWRGQDQGWASSSSAYPEQVQERSRPTHSKGKGKQAAQQEKWTAHWTGEPNKVDWSNWRGEEPELLDSWTKSTWRSSPQKATQNGKGKGTGSHQKDEDYSGWIDAKQSADRHEQSHHSKGASSNSRRWRPVEATSAEET